MREKDIFCNGQAFANTDGTGVVSEKVFNLQLDGSAGNTILTDDEVVGVLNILITDTDVVPATDSGTEGMIIELRTDDAASLATAKDNAGAGYRVLGAAEIPLNELVVGTKIAIGIPGGIVAKEFLGTFTKATSTQIDGSVTYDQWFTNLPDGTENEDRQKVPSR